MHEYLITNPELAWLILAIACFILEALGATGLGLFLAGIAATTLGAIIKLNIFGQLDIISQIVIFLFLTFFWTLILWKPLKKYRQSNIDDFSNMVGDTVKITSDKLNKDDLGQVKWSGTLMRAQLDKSDKKEFLKKNETGYIKLVKGNILFIISK